MQAFVSLKGRPEPHAGMRVRIYRNLNKPSYFSIVALEGPHKGKVLGYSPVVGITDVKLTVSEQSRQRVLERRVRSVHAWIEGNMLATKEALPEGLQSHRKITYQPYVSGFFFDRAEPQTPVHTLESVWTQGPNLLAA